MKKLLLAAVAVAAFAPAAFAEDIGPVAGARVPTNVYHQQQRHVTPNDVYDVDGTYVGTDPDPQVREQLRRDPGYLSQ